MATGKLLGIASRPTDGDPMAELDEVAIDRQHGVAGENRRSGRRQVTVLGLEGWQAACRDAGTDLPWTTRRANLLLEGVALPETKGRRLRIGEVLLEITGETAPCNIMESAHPGLRAALKPGWRGGVTCRVLEGGRVRVGDSAALEAEAA